MRGQGSEDLLVPRAGARQDLVPPLLTPESGSPIPQLACVRVIITVFILDSGGPERPQTQPERGVCLPPWPTFDTWLAVFSAFKPITYHLSSLVSCPREHPLLIFPNVSFLGFTPHSGDVFRN